MGKLLSGRYGEPPEAESYGAISLNECHQKLGMKPSDFVSVGEPEFFNRSFGSKGRYLVFCVDAKEVGSNPIWKAGYYLLPIEAVEVLKAFERNRKGAGPANLLPVQLKRLDTPVPDDILKRAEEWGRQCQPLFFKCACDTLSLKLSPPWGFRRRWKAKLQDPGRCQPALNTIF